MPCDEENYVALFIDWDNLAISTAVDFGGALPDVRAIVKAAQRSGTVLLARAYAEWNATSDRLAVYRAGVEPVYAPTFRFEPEPGSPNRGKSLADPCLVTDCIDTMHLMPGINTFVLVSGDKDLIPIVRLAQLRGKRVVVIGPDFVAAILREMADEYIPYRVLAENSDSPPSTEISPYGARSSRRHQAVSPGPRSAPPTNGQHLPSRHSPPAVATRQAIPVAAKAPVVPESNGHDTPESIEIPQMARVEAVKTEPAIESVRITEETLDVTPLFEVISTILREREQTGKPRLRSTNLKDQLIARISGFNERKYGFGRFKDLLAAAEKASILTVSRTGPVQWVTAAATVSAAPEPSIEITPPAPVTEPVAPPTVEPPAVTDDDSDVVRFILGLRERSRWLTYTYLMTNLLNHLGKGTADAAADTAVRTTLNRLVQSGVLVVDRDPREIDVNGVRHRVKMCHLVDEHPLVATIQTQVAAEAELAPEAAEPAIDPPRMEANDSGANEPARASIEAAAPRVAEPAPPPAPDVPVLIEAPPAAVAPATAMPPFESRDAISNAEPAIPEAEPAAVSVASEREGDSPSAPEAEAASPPEGAIAEPLAVEGAPTAIEAAAAASIPSVAETAAPPAAPEAESIEAAVGLPGAGEANPTSEVATAGNGGGPENGHEKTPLTLEESYAILREVVREAIGPSRPSTGPAAVKNRLVRRLGSFDERALGFGKFKDYLLAAERAGAVRIEVAGTSARVSLPPEEGESPKGETPEKQES